jgi:predicted nucleic acid-binding protein
LYLLDTNIVSELRRPRPHQGVLRWHAELPSEAMFVSAVTLGEMQAGVEKTRRTDPAKADQIEGYIDALEGAHSIIPMDARLYRLWARLMHGKSDGLYVDAMIAATAIAHRLTVVTRNTRDFRHFDVPTFNPFTR